MLKVKFHYAILLATWSQTGSQLVCDLVADLLAS